MVSRLAASSSSRAAHQTVMVPQTVMVSPESVQYEHILAQYGIHNRVEMVSPGYSYNVPVAPRQTPAAGNSDK